MHQQQITVRYNSVPQVSSSYALSKRVQNRKLAVSERPFRISRLFHPRRVQLSVSGEECAGLASLFRVSR